MNPKIPLIVEVIRQLSPSERMTTIGYALGVMSGEINCPMLNFKVSMGGAECVVACATQQPYMDAIDVFMKTMIAQTTASTDGMQEIVTETAAGADAVHASILKTNTKGGRL